MKKLAAETATALLEAIRDSAGNASSNMLRDLAEAYSLVVQGAPQRPPSPPRGI